VIASTRSSSPRSMNRSAFSKAAARVRTTSNVNTVAYCTPRSEKASELEDRPDHEIGRR
jgi:hypothetical protein